MQKLNLKRNVKPAGKPFLPVFVLLYLLAAMIGFRFGLRAEVLTYKELHRMDVMSKENQIALFKWPCFWKALADKEDDQGEVGPDGEVGPLQITQAVIDDLNHAEKTDTYTLEKAKDRATANSYCVKYIKLWFPAYRKSVELEKRPIAEGIALLWRHGPVSGWIHKVLDNEYSKAVNALYNANVSRVEKINKKVKK